MGWFYRGHDACFGCSIVDSPLHGCSQGQTSRDAQDRLFEQKVRPILTQRCLTCHGAKKAKSGLRLDTRQSLLRGGEQGAAVIPGSPEKSLFIQAIGYEGDLKMPPSSRLPDAEISILKDWVAGGLPWPDQRPLAEPSVIADTSAKHWAFKPVAQTTPPQVRDRSGVNTPVDRFVVAALDKAGLTPSVRADRRTLIRRATFDLLGLPPTPEEVAAFEADPEPDAYEN